MLREEQNTIQRGDYMRRGMDISYYQGDIDFDAVKRSGIEFVIIREGYRNSVDNRFFEYVKRAKEAGIEIFGVYHFSYALNMKEAEEEARFCIENVKKAGLNWSTLVFFDFEYDTVKKAASKGVTLTKLECNNNTIAFCEKVRDLGFFSGVYTNLDYYKNWYAKEVLDKYFVWLADYKGGPDYNCMVQQYTSTGKVPGINGPVDLDYHYKSEFKMEGNIVRSRNEVVKLATSWLGKNEKDGSYKEIIDIYNSISRVYLPRGIKMQYDWSWCACTWSAIAIKLGYLDIIPIEISCGELIKRAKNNGIWVEDDAYIPSPGDAILYDWDDKGVGDNTGWPDHVGTVVYVNKSAGYITVIEGNYNDSVKKRTISINGKYIRGYITPKYTDDVVVTETAAESSKDIEVVAREVISGLWGDGVVRKTALERSGFNYTEVRAKVNEILNTSKDVKIDPMLPRIEASCKAQSKDENEAGTWRVKENLYCRNDAGTNKKALCVIPKGTKVVADGSYTEVGLVKWLLVKFVLDGIEYTGFSSSKYLER